MTLDSDGLRRPPEHLSWSQVSVLDHTMPFGCARSWAIERILGVPYEPSAAMRLGSAFDQAVNTLFIERASRKGDLAAPLLLDDALEVLNRELGIAFDALTDDEERRTLAAASAMAAASLEQYAVLHANTPVLTTQREVGWWVDEIKVIGYIDRVDLGPTITDLKVTGRSKKRRDGTWDEEQTLQWYWQLAFYAVALESEVLDSGQEFAWPVAAQVDQVVLRAGQAKPSIDTWPCVIEEHAKATVQQMVRRAWSLARSGRYPANPGPKCGNCGVRDICRSIQAANEPDFAVAWARTR